MSPEYNIIFVYILQAHSNDWKVGKFSHINQPLTIKDRQQLALKFKDDFKLTLPIYIDDMNNNFNSAFGSWPHRSYVITTEKKMFGFSKPEYYLKYKEKVIAVEYKSITDKLIEVISDGIL